MTISEKIQQTKKKADMLERKRKVQQKQQREAEKKLTQHRNYILGELVTTYFPEVTSLTPGTEIDNVKIFMPIKAFLSALSSDKQLMKELKSRAEKLITNLSKPF